MDRCVFCVPQSERVFVENDLAFALWDAFPVTERHALIVSRRHVQDYFALTSEELLACDDLLRQAREPVLASDPSVEGFNVGANIGEVAGQTIFHCHIHLIPRRSGDVKNPRGGVRHLIPGKGAY
ncbi:MAG: HIT domain-containing protein [Nitrospira sp.]|nr:HIT domain-containing protein [Nitrospira sp.]